MISKYRDWYNHQWTPELYKEFLSGVYAAHNHVTPFRIAETPFFIPALLKNRLLEACDNINKVICQPNFKELTQNAIPDPSLLVPGEDSHTTFLQMDFGITLDEKGRIPVDQHLQTSVPGVYAIGDVIQGAMLAHKAEEEGVFVAETMAGQKPHIHYNLIPGVVYTWPEVASVGYTEEQLKEKGTPYKPGKFPFRALGRARASMDLDGMVKVLAHKETDEILGVHIVGARAADMIAEAVALMEFRASAEDAARMSHAHPTYTEAFKEACLAATANRPIHV